MTTTENQADQQPHFQLPTTTAERMELAKAWVYKNGGATSIERLARRFSISNYNASAIVREYRKTHEASPEKKVKLRRKFCFKPDESSEPIPVGRLRLPIPEGGQFVVVEL